MTKTTKDTATSKPAEAEATKAVEKATATATDAVKNATNLFSALTLSTRKTVEGVIEVDKAILGFAKDAVTDFYDHSRASMKATCLNDLIDLQAGYAHARIEAGAANAREVVDLSRTKAKDAYAPVKEIVDSLRPGKAA